MADTVYEEGREAYGVIDPRKCPYIGDALREAWFRGYEDAKRSLRTNDA